MKFAETQHVFSSSDSTLLVQCTEIYRLLLAQTVKLTLQITTSLRVD